MSFATFSRRSVPPLKCLGRRSVAQHAHDNTPRSLASTPPSSRKPPPEENLKVSSHRTLPPSKMRALVALYHQSGSWVTRENLDAAIDKAFVPDHQKKSGLFVPTQEGIDYQDLKNTMNDVKYYPKMAQLEADAAFRRLGARHRSFPRREELMLEALYGVEVHDNKVLPGWEVVQDMEDGLKRRIEEDKKSEASRRQS